MTTTNVAAIQALAPLGFSEIEALVYAQLLLDSPATGYRISQAVGKPTANTYKAIASLEQKGAVIVDDGESRLCRPVPPEELLSRLGREFKRHREEAERALTPLLNDESDDRIYRLQSVDQVLERARAMLERARSVVLIDIFPACFERLAGDLHRAAVRGVRVAAKTYRPATVKDVLTVRSPGSDRMLERWPGEQLNLVIDAEEHLLALLSRNLDAVHQAVWSESTFLSCMHHNHLSSEIALTGLEPDRFGDGAWNPLQRFLLTQSLAPGFRKLIERYGRPAAEES